MARLSCVINKYIPVLYLMIIILILSGTEGEARSLTASQYEIELSLEYPTSKQSEKIFIERGEQEAGDNVYLQRFKLVNKENRGIPAEYIRVTTPYYEDTLDESYRFLLMKQGQTGSWLRVSLLPGAAFAEPGIYEAVLEIPGLEWELMVEVEVEPFVSLKLMDNRLEFEINQPATSDFFVIPNLCHLQIESNHRDWELRGQLEEERLAATEEHYIPQKQLYFRLEDPDQRPGSREKEPGDFTRMTDRGDTLIFSGNPQKKRLVGVRFGIELDQDWTRQPAGRYTGTIIFTIKEG